MNCPFCIKQCSDCKRLLVANSFNFHKAKSSKYGVAHICKTCKNKRTKENRLNNLEKRREYDKQYYAKNKETKNKKWKEWRDNHKEERQEYVKKYNKEHKEELKEKALNYYYDNREEILSKKREKYKANTEQEKERKKQWRINNPGKAFSIDIKTRIKRQEKINQYKDITNEQWLEMMNYFNWSCAYSGAVFSSHNIENDRTTDHIVALNNNGPHVIWNCVPATTSCNSSKQDKDMLDWYKEQEYFDENKLNKIYEWQKYAKEKWGDNNDN